MTESPASTTETTIRPAGGWSILVPWLIAVGGLIAVFVVGPDLARFIALPAVPLLILVLPGFFLVEPNQSRVLVLFGRYRGTVRGDGFYWTNPFTLKRKISLRAHSLDGDTLKVNDAMGNPIEISAVTVWRVANTARASFDVESYEHFVRVQSDAALRHLATSYPYDKGMSDEVTTTLREDATEVSAVLEEELRERLAQAGIEVQEARLNHLAYAPEIAGAMLQRQQAMAVVAARQKIVEGAVGMVDMALTQLKEQNILELDDDRRATLVGNLLVVLCGQSNPTPVLNTGSLYN
jgi:SPFH domain/Band 7 family protein